MKKLQSMSEQELLRKLQEPVEQKGAMEKMVGMMKGSNNYKNKERQKANLMELLESNVPFKVNVSDDNRKRISNNSDGASVNKIETVTSVLDSGDLGGILCVLGESDAEGQIKMVSITHLQIPLNSPLRKEVVAYQKHRIKKLKRQGDFR